MGRFDLDKLKVESFVTSLELSDKKQLQGGAATDDCSKVGCDMTDEFEGCGEDFNSHAESCKHACHTEILDDHCRTPNYPC